MSLSNQNIDYVLTSFDAGISPLQIYDALLSAGVTELEPNIILQCLRENGRLSQDDPQSYEYLGDLLLSYEPIRVKIWQRNQAPGSSTATQEGQGFDPPVSPTSTIACSPTSTTAWVDPGPTLPWDALADSFTMAAHNYRQPVPDICAVLRKNGYNVTQSQVLTSLNWQGVITGC